MTGRMKHAFPNAYLEVDEPPRPNPFGRVAAAVGLLGTGAFSLIIVALHFEPTGYDPVTQFISDYAVGAYGWQMSTAFFAGGVGLSSLGVASLLTRSRRRGGVGASLLLLAGVALFLVGIFPTDLEGAPATFHGTMHTLLSVIVFTFSPAGIIVISSTLSRRWVWYTVSSLAASLLVVLVLSAFFPATPGLAERVYVGALAAWWILGSARILRAS